MVSVIIPVYNVEAYVERCLHSVVAQKQIALEVIVVDDCGTDSSMNIVKRVFEQVACSHRIEHHTRNRGLSAARNTGLDVARGKYVYFLDSDDWLKDETVLWQLVEIAENNQSVCVVGEYQDCESSSGKIMSIPYQYGKLHQLHTSAEVVDCFVNNRIPVTAWNKLVRRDFLQENRLYFEEGILHEDSLWTFQLMSRLPSLTLLPEVTYCYALNPESMMNKMDETKIKRRTDSSVVVLDKMESVVDSFCDIPTKNKLSVYIDETRNYMYRRLLTDGLTWQMFTRFYRQTHRPMKWKKWGKLSMKQKVAHLDQLLPSYVGRYYFLFLYKFLYQK